MHPSKTPSIDKSKKRRFGVFWVCPNCEGTPEFEHDEMMTHITKIHGIDIKTINGTRRMLMHMDGKDWFAWEYEWEIDGKKFLQSTMTKRSGQNARNWE